MATTAPPAPSIAATFPAPGVAAAVHRALAAARIPDARAAGARLVIQVRTDVQQSRASRPPGRRPWLRSAR